MMKSPTTRKRKLKTEKSDSSIDEHDDVESAEFVSITIPDEDNDLLNLLLFEDDQIDNTKYRIEHPMKCTVGADLLIKCSVFSSEATISMINVENSENSDAVEVLDNRELLIPVHRKILEATVPYFSAMFNNNNNWRQSEDKIGSTKFVTAPEHIPGNVVLKYIAMKYNSVNKKLGNENLDTRIKEMECLDLLDLAIFWADDKIKTKFEKWLENNINVNLISEIYDHPRLKELLKPIVMNHYNYLEGKNKQLSKEKDELTVDLSIEKKRNRREFFWFETIDAGLRVYSGASSEMTGRTPIYKIRGVTSLKKLMNAYCQQQGIMINYTRFQLNGNTLVGSNTAENLGLMNRDDIVVTEVEESDAHTR